MEPPDLPMAIPDEIRHYPLGGLMVTQLIFLMRGHRLVSGSVVDTQPAAGRTDGSGVEGLSSVAPQHSNAPAAPREKSIAPLMQLVDADMQRVNQMILDMAAANAEMIPEIARHLIDSGGKRLRPMLTLAAALACGYRGDDHVKLAATVEFMHTATLLHDDVVDESELRRGKPSARMVWGNQASVLVGDYLLGQAFRTMVEVGSLDALAVLSRAAAVIAEGEVLQLMNMHDASLDQAAYLRVIRSKTAKLFEASARLGAVLAHADARMEQACADYGQALGTAFQVIDDVLDYDGDAGEMGKNLGDDLREGKATLPLIAAMERGTAEQREVVRHAIETGGVAELDRIVAIVKETGALAVTRDAAAAEARRAVDAARLLPPNAYSQGLLQLAAQLLQRRN